MKINLDPKKGVEKISGALQKTSDFGKDISQKAVAKVQEGSKVLVDKTKDEAYQLRLKKYNPLFPTVYQSPDFNIPNMIVVVDDAERKGIDVCEGAIGWLGKVSGVEVLYLYDEAVEMSGLEFIPVAKCDEVYYVDQFDRSRFIQVKTLFDRAANDKLAELKYIAGSLGAKQCTIEISESQVEEKGKKRKFGFKESAEVENLEISISKSAEYQMSRKNSKEQSRKVTSTFEGNNTPIRPKLKWFAHDDNIKRLIDMRCEGTNVLKSEELRLTGASFVTMSQKAAYAADAAIDSFGRGKHISAESLVMKECSTTFIYKIEF